MDNLHIVNLASYNKPLIIEDKRKDWIAYGEDNNYYKYLITLFTNSTTNNSIINGVSNLIYGKGLDALDSSTKTDEYAALKSIFNNDCLKKVCLDLKLLGEACFQVLYKDGKVIKAEHFPRQTLRPEKMNDDGEIEAYYYAPDWEKVKQNTKLKKIANFGYGNGTEPEIKVVKKYVSGYDYICPVDYQGALAYCELESEISDYLMNDVQNNFSGTKVVNFNNGVPDREKQLQIKSEVMGKLTGSRGEKVIVAFNNNAESKTTVDDIPLDNAPIHYEYLANECIRKIIMGHRVTSPLLLGVRDGNSGLGNNADEIKTASLLFNNVTIKPYQDLIINCIDHILAVNEISLKLYFRTLQPLEFIETDNAVTDEAKEEETGVKLASQVVNKDFAIIDDRLAYSTPEKAEEMAKNIGCEGIHVHEYEEQEWYMPCEYHNKEALQKYKCPPGYKKNWQKHRCEKMNDASDEELLSLIEGKGEDEKSLLKNGYVLIDERKVIDSEEANLDEQLKLARVPKDTSTNKSEYDGKTNDGEDYIVRYQYAPQAVSNNSREFCKKMVSAAKIYRKEDLDRESAANKELAAKNENTYNLFLWKGGANCKHYWLRKTYMKEKDGIKIDPNNPNATPIYRADRADKGIVPPNEPREVGIKPADLPNKGYKNPR